MILTSEWLSHFYRVKYRAFPFLCSLFQLQWRNLMYWCEGSILSCFGPFGNIFYAFLTNTFLLLGLKVCPSFSVFQNRSNKMLDLLGRKRCLGYKKSQNTHKFSSKGIKKLRLGWEKTIWAILLLEARGWVWAWYYWRSVGSRSGSELFLQGSPLVNDVGWESPCVRTTFLKSPFVFQG